MNKLWKTIIISGLAVLFVGVGVVGIVAANHLQAGQKQTAVQAVPLNADTIYRLVNDERMKAGLQPLLRDARLDATAQARADDMDARNYFSHYDPVTGESLVKIKQTNQECKEASENISDTDGYADNNSQVLIGWMHSKLHHDAILNPAYTLTGVAIKGTKVVQHFCVSK